jgi:hypothetical protein
MPNTQNSAYLEDENFIRELMISEMYTPKYRSDKKY